MTFGRRRPARSGLAAALACATALVLGVAALALWLRRRRSVGTEQAPPGAERVEPAEREGPRPPADPAPIHIVTVVDDLLRVNH